MACWPPASWASFPWGTVRWFRLHPHPLTDWLLNRRPCSTTRDSRSFEVWRKVSSSPGVMTSATDGVYFTESHLQVLRNRPGYCRLRERHSAVDANGGSG